jgi:hypothetical protein
VAAEPANTFAPFTTAEWIGMLPYTETYTGCLTWPAPTHPADPPVPVGVPMDATNVPVLILNGSIDSLTPAAGGAHIQQQIGSAAQAYVAANMVHLVALDSPYPCGPAVMRAFIEAPTAKLNTSCLPKIPAVRAVPSYPQTVDEITPALGNASVAVRRLAAVAIAEAGDALIRYNYVDARSDLGMRGGTVAYDNDGDARLNSVRYTDDTTTSGSVTVTATGASGRVIVHGPTATAAFGITWGAGSLATATFNGVVLTAPAP